MAACMGVILIAFIVFSYKREKCYLISPFFIACLAISASYLIILINYNNWSVAISGKFVLYVTTALISLGLGTYFANKLVKYKKKNGNARVRDVSFAALVVMNFVSCASTILYFSKVLRDYGFSLSLGFSLRDIYNNSTGYSAGFVFNQFMEISIFTAYISTFILLRELLTKRRGDYLCFSALPLIFFVAIVLITTDRNIFLRFAIYSICVFIALFLRYRKMNKKTRRRLFFIILFVGLCAIFVFYMFGKSKNYTSGLFDQLSIYGGSGLYDFNLWLESYSGPYYYGQSVFSTFISIVEMFVQPLGITFTHYSEIKVIDDVITFTSANGYNYFSNIYSAFRPFVEDFGYFGMIIYPFIYGLAFQSLLNFARRGNSEIRWILYCALIYPLIFFPVQEQGIRRWHLGFVYETFWCIAIYYIIFSKKMIIIGKASAADIHNVRAHSDYNRKHRKRIHAGYN